MDLITKGVLSGWVRHLFTVAAGAVGISAYVTEDITNAAVAMGLGVIGFGWSWLAKYSTPKA